MVGTSRLIFPILIKQQGINHKNYLAGRKIKITNPATGKSIIVRPSDVGPGVPKNCRYL